MPSQAAAYGLTFAFLLLLTIQILFLNGIRYTGVLRHGFSKFPKTRLIEHQSIIA